MVGFPSTDANCLDFFQFLVPFGHIGKILQHDIELVRQLLRTVILAIVGQSRVSHIHNQLLEKVTCIFALAECLELFKIEHASLVFIDHVKELFDVNECYLDTMLLEHLLQFKCVKSTRTIVIELEKDVFDIILRLQLSFRLHIEVFCGLSVARH